LAIDEQPTKEAKMKTSAKNRNPVLAEAIFVMWPSVAAFCREYGFSNQYIGELLYLKKSPLNADNDWLPTCLKLSEIFGISVSDLFHLKLYGIEDPDAVEEIPFSHLPRGAFIYGVPAPKSLATEITDKLFLEALASAFLILSPKEERIVKLRFGLEDGCEYSYEEIGQMLGKSHERIRQIVLKSLRKLRWYGNMKIDPVTQRHTIRRNPSLEELWEEKYFLDCQQE
jgi:hypothetical protein